jgi:hypothetical protein
MGGDYRHKLRRGLKSEEESSSEGPVNICFVVDEKLLNIK